MTPTLHSALRERCDQWAVSDHRRPPTDARLDDALRAATPASLAPLITPDTAIDAEGIRAISDALLADLEARGDDHSTAPFWLVHDASGVTESDVARGLYYVVARVLIAAETRLLDADAHRFPKLRGLRAETDPDVRVWLDECVRDGMIPASALTRFPELLSLPERDRFWLLTIAQPLDDRGWIADDLAQYARGFLHRRPGYADALVQTTIEAVSEAPWSVAVETIQRIRTAADGLPWHDARS